MTCASYLLRSHAIFDATGREAFNGYVAIGGSRIIALGEGDGNEYAGPRTQVLELGDRLVIPGLVDVHCFFNGWLLQHAGADLSSVSSIEEAFDLVRPHARNGLFIGHSLPMHLADVDESLVDEAFGDVPAVLVAEGAETMVMNTAAERSFGFTPQECWSERAHLLLKAVMDDDGLSVPLYREYLAMMNSYGVTSTKEMGFDDSWFVDRVQELEDAGELTVRLHLMSQPVGKPIDIEYGIAMQDRFAHDPFISFSGFNQMTDGSISQHEGEMKEPYLDADTRCALDIDWSRHREDVLRADAAGLRFSLHAQGDGAVSHALDILEQCRCGDGGKLELRHAMTDLECADPADYQRMAELGVVAEVYPLIQSIADRAGKLAMIDAKVGPARGRNYWNRRAMLDAGVTVSCGTDLPMTLDDVGVGVYSACGGYFPEGGEPFNPENTITPAELICAWTAGGSYNLGQLDRTGTLEVGKYADIAVFDVNVLACDPIEARSCRCRLTMLDGRVVFDGLDG